MKSLLKDIQDFMENDEGFRQRAKSYTNAMKTEDWKFMSDAIMIVRGIMMKDMFSYHHTNSDAQEKDVVQRTYYNINQILDFLSNPEGWIKKKSKLKQGYADITSKVNRAMRGGTK